MSDKTKGTCINCQHYNCLGYSECSVDLDEMPIVEGDISCELFEFDLLKKDKVQVAKNEKYQYSRTGRTIVKCNEK